MFLDNLVASLSYSNVSIGACISLILDFFDKVAKTVAPGFCS